MTKINQSQILSNQQFKFNQMNQITNNQISIDNSQSNNFESNDQLMIANNSMTTNSITSNLMTTSSMTSNSMTINSMTNNTMTTNQMMLNNNLVSSNSQLSNSTMNNQMNNQMIYNLSNNNLNGQTNQTNRLPIYVNSSNSISSHVINSTSSNPNQSANYFNDSIKIDSSNQSNNFQNTQSNDQLSPPSFESQNISQFGTLDTPSNTIQTNQQQLNLTNYSQVDQFQLEYCNNHLIASRFIKKELNDNYEEKPLKQVQHMNLLNSCLNKVDQVDNVITNYKNVPYNSMNIYNPINFQLMNQSNNNNSKNQMIQGLSNTNLQTEIQQKGVIVRNTFNNGIATFQPINMEDQERVKQERKKIKNREAALKCRIKKMNKIKQLEINSSMLKGEVSNLSKILLNSKTKNNGLRIQFMNHIQKGCPIGESNEKSIPIRTQSIKQFNNQISNNLLINNSNQMIKQYQMTSHSNYNQDTNQLIQQVNNVDQMKKKIFVPKENQTCEQLAMNYDQMKNKNFNSSNQMQEISLNNQNYTYSICNQLTNSNQQVTNYQRKIENSTIDNHLNNDNYIDNQLHYNVINDKNMNSIQSEVNQMN